MTINLLPHKEAGFVEKFFSWILTFGRFIIIGTELIVLLAFASRFKFDRDLVDLHDKIQMQETIVKSLSTVETRSRNLQQRLTQIKSLNQEAQASLAVFTEIPSLVPANVFLDSLVVQEKTLRIEARTASGEGVSSFIRQLRASNLLSNLSLERITRDETLGGQIKFSVSATLTYANSRP